MVQKVFLKLNCIIAFHQTFEICSKISLRFIKFCFSTKVIFKLIFLK